MNNHRSNTGKKKPSSRFNMVRKKYTGRKIQSTNKYKLAFRTLEKLLPRVFNLHKPKPLSLGIREDIINLNLGISNRTIRSALHYYCNRYQYLVTIRDGVSRIDTSGKPTSAVISKEEQAAAYERCQQVYKTIKENNKRKKMLQK